MPVRPVRHRERAARLAQLLHEEMHNLGRSVLPWPDLAEYEREDLTAAMDALIQAGEIDCRLCPPYQED